MKKLLILAALAAGITTASAQAGRSNSAATRAGSNTKSKAAPTAVAVTPNYSTGNGQRTGTKINTAPATGATRASRSSSTAKAAHQGKPTGSGNIESMSKNSNATPGSKQ